MPPEETDSRPTTIRDVAAAAGVSPAAVSLVLRHSSQISKGTAARVKAVVEKLGYRPNPLVSALMLHRAMERNERGVPDHSTDVIFSGVWNPGKTLARGQGRDIQAARFL